MPMEFVVQCVSHQAVERSQPPDGPKRVDLLAVQFARRHRSQPQPHHSYRSVGSGARVEGSSKTAACSYAFSASVNAASSMVA